MTIHVQHWNHHELKATANDRAATQAYNFFSSTHQRRDIFLPRYILRDWANEKAVQILKRLGDVVVRGKTRVGTDYVNQYSCIFDRKMIEERRVSCSKVRQQESVPAEMLSNLERAKAGNYFLDLTYGL